jgi:hypothetical protein
VADRYINGRFDIQSHPHLSKIHECTAAARRNLNLGHHISRLGRFPKLLHAGLHNVFNAAVILQMHQLLVDSPQDNTDEQGISFAISAFESEARSGNIYAEDCTRVLLDLNMLVRKLRTENSQQISSTGQTDGLQNQTSPYTDVYPIASSTPRTNEWRTQNAEQTSTLHASIDEQDPNYQELMAWLNVDDLQLYNI